MSAPTKCEKCGAEATYAIQMPCGMGCGGLMYYDKTRGVAARIEAPMNREAFVELVRGLADDLAADEGYDELAERIWTALRTARAVSAGGGTEDTNEKG